MLQYEYSIADTYVYMTNLLCKETLMREILTLYRPMQSLSLDGKNNFSIKQNSMRLRVAVVSMVTHAVRVIIGGITLTSITMITSVM